MGKKEVSLEKLRIKLAPNLKSAIKASWIHNEMLYVICLNKHITNLTKHFSKKYRIPEEKVRVGTIEDLIKEITSHNTRVLISVRDGKIIYDPFKLLRSLQINIQKGMMSGTREAIMRKFLLIKDYIKEIESTKTQVFDNIYTSTLEAAQTALLLKGHPIFVPRLIPDAVKKHLKGHGLERTHILYVSEIIQTFKKYEHKKISLPSGKKLDDLAKKSGLFREAVKNLV
jgi:hypothetical protein